MGFDSRNAAKKYSPQDNDTLERIAERESTLDCPLTARDIALFNWGTDDPDTIDELLRDKLGCYKRGGNKRFAISADVAPSEPLLIPKAFKKSSLSTQQRHKLGVREPKKPPKQLEGCTRISGVTFEFDCSFILPSVVDELSDVEAELNTKPAAKVMIFGHTDKVGSESYNKGLSERRARSVYAFIVNKPDVWEDLYNEEGWGIKAVQHILKDMGGAYDPGSVDGVDGPRTQTAVRQFQADNGLAVDGVTGPETRGVMFGQYMSGKHDIEIDDSRFMDPKHMGCGEFNPVVETEEPNVSNRRVTFYLFNEARLPVLPCSAGSISPCSKQMSQPLPRHFDSFHCSFYDSIAKNCASDPPGKGGQKGGGPGAIKPPAGNPGGAPPAKNKPKTCSITSQTAVNSPADRARTKIGVGEEVELTVSPSPATWTIVSGKGILTPAAGRHAKVTFTAADKKENVTIEAKTADASCTITFNVVQPTHWTMKRVPGTNVQHMANRPRCAWRGYMYLQPSDVNFINVETREKDSTYSGSGCYSNFNGDFHGSYPTQPDGVKASAWFPIVAHTAADGSTDNVGDTIDTGDPGAATGNAPPFTPGSGFFPITIQWKTWTGPVHDLPVSNQEDEIFANGKCESRKGGNTESTMWNDPPSTF